eukprot:14522520-Ditylum_brightwellii.AAC.1
MSTVTSTAKHAICLLSLVFITTRAFVPSISTHKFGIQQQHDVIPSRSCQTPSFTSLYATRSPRNSSAGRRSKNNSVKSSNRRGSGRGSGPGGNRGGGGRGQQQSGDTYKRGAQKQTNRFDNDDNKEDDPF